MPYINPAQRALLDPHLRPLVATIKEVARAEGEDVTLGMIAYCVMVFLVHLSAARYSSMAKVMSAVDTARLEFFRRHLGPYEADKMKENGDV